MKHLQKVIALLLAAVMALSLMPAALAVIVDDGTTCPSDPYGTGWHNWMYVSGQEANCQHGWIETWRCEYCGKTYTTEYGEKGDHVFGDYQTINPTCTQEGGTRRTCRLCGYVEELWEIAPLGHDYQPDRKEPTCTQEGYERLVCSRCGATAREVVLQATGHDWDYGQITNDATCTASGTLTYTCRNCGAIRTETIPAYGHDPMWKEGYPATCTENGKTDGQVCGACGVVIEAQTVIPALGHDWGDWFTYINPTCTDPGQDVRYCSRCQARQTRDIAATGHVWSQSAVTQEPTCTIPGVRTWYCYNTIGAVHTKEESIAALGHDWSEWKTEGGATCTEPGMRYRTCARCNLWEKEDLPAQNHTWGSWKVEIPGTCVQKEMNVRTCSRCGLEEYRYGDYGPHDWGEWQTIIEPTATEPGIEMRFCKINPDHVEEREIPPTGDAGTGDLTVAKRVDKYGATENDFTRDFAFTLTLDDTGVNGAYGDLTFTDGAARFTLRDGQSVTASGLPAGTAYTVAEEALNAYAVKSEGAEGVISAGTAAANKASFTNYRLSQNMQIALIWDDNGNQAGKRPDSVQMTLLGDGEPARVVTLNEENGWFYALELALLYNDADERIEYVWQEDVPEGYAVTATVADSILTTVTNTYGESGGESGTPTEEKAELTVTIETLDGDSPYGEKTEFKSGEEFWFHGSVTNTGNVDVELWDCDKADSDGWSVIGYDIGSRYLLHPGETVAGWGGSWFAGVTGTIHESDVTPGTETETLAGTLTYTAKVYGYKPGTDEVICTAEGSAAIGLLKDEGPHPAISVYIWADPDAGEGKRYEGATVTYHYEVTNTGDCPVYVPWWPDCSSDYHDASAPNGHTVVDGMWIAGSMALLNPGETYTDLTDDGVYSSDVEKGYLIEGFWNDAWYYKADGNIGKIGANSNKLEIPLTYPDGQEPEPANPALTVTWKYDNIGPAGGGWYDTTEENTYGPEDSAFAFFDVLNAGNVPLRVKTYFSFGNGYTSEINYPDGYDLGKLIPGTSEEHNWGTWTLSERVTPGTETEELMGTADITIWAKGFDPETGEELCTSNEITRSWPVRKPGPTEWNIPSLSAMTAEVKVSAGYESSDPAGYQLGEKYRTHLITENTGETAIPAMTIHVYDPYDGWTDTWYPIDFEPGQRFTGSSGSWNKGKVTAEDVARGYISFPPVEFTWEDPDSGETMHAYSNSLTLPVITKTGLLVQKTVGNTPANGQYFTAGETIQWQVAVTNTSNEPIKNVTVTDQGETIGEFAEITPGETVECAVPGHEVTEYDEFVGTVSNQAVAKGTDLKDAAHTWFGNIATAPTSQKGADEHPLIPPTVPEKGQDGDPDGGTSGGGIPGEGTPETPETPGTPGGGHDDTGDPYGVIIETSVYKTTAHGPANGEYYELGETVDYTITVRNTGETVLENVSVTDSLHGLAAIETIPSLAPGEEKTVAFAYAVTQADIDLGYIVNQANITYVFLGGYPGTPQKSNKVYVIAGENGGIPGGGAPGDGDETGGKTGGGISLLTGGGSGDFCALTLTALGGGEIHYSLHACAGHTEAAKAAEAASAEEAVRIWRAEIDKLYQELYDAAQAEAKAIVMNDRAVFWAYVDAYEALYGDEALASLLRLRCAELCCMSHTAPDALPDSILGSYATIMGGGQYDACERAFTALDGSDCQIIVRLNKELARTLEDAISTVRGTKSYAVDQAFVQVQAQWQMALDSATNAAYKAADKEARKTIVACRKLLDQVIAARTELLNVIYPNSPEIIQEAIANLYRDAALDASKAK